MSTMSATLMPSHRVFGPVVPALRPQRATGGHRRARGVREQRPVPASESGGPVLEQRGLDAEEERPLGLAQLPEVALDLCGNQISARWRRRLDGVIT